jgi:diguanylate cyclase (GGDEF)-like protein
MELLLWRWSTSVQITSDLMIAVFFVVLARSVGRAELRPWVNAWLANLVALSVTIFFWLAPPPPSSLAFTVVCWLYICSKTTFVVLLVAGTAGFLDRAPVRMPYREIVAGVALFSLFAAFGARSISLLGTIEATTIAICLSVGAAFLSMKKTPAYVWLGAGFVVRAALAVAEAAAYALQLSSGELSRSQTVASFLAAASSFDTGAEWMIALGSVLTLYRTIQRELTQSNQELHAAKEELQVLLDRDLLTGLFNRRSLPPILAESQATGATILFFDLNDFKAINDSYGHHVGDECLKRFARALQESFRTGDKVIRYAGDEFIVVAPGTEPVDLAERIERVRILLRSLPAEGPRFGFSVGVADLPVQGDPEEALRAADKAMYRDKAA